VGRVRSSSNGDAGADATTNDALAGDVTTKDAPVDAIVDSPSDAGADVKFVCPKQTTCLPGETMNDAGTCEGLGTLVSGQQPWSIVLGPCDVYFTNWGQQQPNGSIQKVSKIGGTPVVLASSQYTPWDLAVSDTRVFWGVPVYGDSGAGEMLSVELDGGTPVALTAAHRPYGVAIDSTYLYWVDYSTDNTQQGGEVRKVPLDGGTSVLLASKQEQSYDIAVDPSHVYWSNYGLVGGNNGSVWRADLDGSNASALAQNQKGLYDIAIDGQNVYWTVPVGDFVMKAPKDAGTDDAGVALASSQITPYGIAVDEGYVYWTNQGFSEVRKVPIDGGTATPIATGLVGPVGIAVDDTSVYVTSADKILKLTPK
jgi:hypothetical protein